MKRTYYTTCPHCGANNDPGERCDCTKKTALDTEISTDGMTAQNRAVQSTPSVPQIPPKGKTHYPERLDAKMLTLMQKAEAVDCGNRSMRYGEVVAIINYHDGGLFYTSATAYRLGFMRGIAAGKAKKRRGG